MKDNLGRSPGGRGGGLLSQSVGIDCETGHKSGSGK